MSEDQFQRHVDFIVAQQAKFTKAFAKLEENLGRHEQENREMFAKFRGHHIEPSSTKTGIRSELITTPQRDSEVRKQI